MRVMVAIHDVTPALAADVEALWALCAAHGVRPALFVVPDWHGGWPLAEHPRFVAWLRARVADGAEIFLHGERHDEVGLRRGWRAELRARGWTAGEAEFLALGEAEAAARIARGVALLRRLELDPLGFVAPAWLASAGARRAIAMSGLRRSEDARGVLLHDRRLRLASPVVRWSARTALRARASALVAAVRRRAHATHPLVRLGLHPSDLGHPRTAASLRRELAHWLAGRTWCGYAAL